MSLIKTIKTQTAAINTIKGVFTPFYFNKELYVYMKHGDTKIHAMHMYNRATAYFDPHTLVSLLPISA